MDNPDAFSLSDFIADINADIDSEIDVRTRLAETLEARIAWAVILKEAAEGKAIGTASQSTFKDVAFETILANEENSQFLFASAPTPPPLPPTNQQVPRAAKKIASLGHKPKASFLYIRSSALNHSTNDSNHLYLLKCPSCGRTAFTSLQGLLNHARLSHSLEWGTHDECIRACAVPDNDMDISQGAEVGLGPSGVLAGLRTIFERAVGVSKGVINHQTQPTNSPTDSTQESTPSTQTQLNLTLGLHEESPALAPFLGKVAVRRQIAVHDEDVDIVSRESEPSPKHRWKMPFAHRSFREGLTKSYGDDSGHAISSDSKHQANDDSEIVQGAPERQHSRFHFVARIILADRSMWVSPGQERHSLHKRVADNQVADRRPSAEPSHTHKWMISVDAPSYAFHITSILKSVQVTPETNDSSAVSQPLPTSEPPFIVLGTSNAPFLAKIELAFTGTGRDGPNKLEQKITLHHWVDLDPLRSGNVFLGQEQILDIELDKHTQLNPVKTGYLPISSKVHWSLPTTEISHIPKARRSNSTFSPRYLLCSDVLNASGYEQTLTKLAKQYPLFVKGRQKPPPGVNQSYSNLLPSSLPQWAGFCLGRRKAIAWVRSQAICKAYEEIRLSSTDNTLNLIELKTADVYRWLSDNGMFPNNSVQQTVSGPEESHVKQEETQTLPTLSHTVDQWCTLCGKFVEPHRPDSQHSCNSMNIPRVSRLSRINARSILQEQQSLSHPPHHDFKHHPRSTRAAHPHLVLWVKEITESAKLSAFPTIRPVAPFHLDSLGDSFRDVDISLAPFTALSLAVQSMVKNLVECGLRVIEEQQNNATPTARHTEKTSAEAVSRKRLLTPTHILSGLSAYGRGDGGGDSTGHASAGHIHAAHRHMAHKLSCHAPHPTTTSVHTAQPQPTEALVQHTSSAPSPVHSVVNVVSSAHKPSSTSHSSSTHAPSSTRPLSAAASASPQTTKVPAVAKPTSLAKSLVPNNIKAGIAGGDAYPFVKDHIGWWYDWSPNPSKPGAPIAVPMLWGNGTVDRQDAERLVAFQHLSTVPPYVLGFEEPDCPSGSGSAGMSVEDGVAKWQSLIAPLGKKGAKLGSPSMCKQIDETWLAEFSQKISTPWDFTAVHINKNNMEGVAKVIEHYMAYGKPIWVTEFACVNDHPNFEPCTDQGEINKFIGDIVDYLQNNDQVYAYAYSNGLGLGDVWPMMNGNSLSESGKAYLAAISKYH
ncbi:hypothetical protein CVT24_010310 [Panaeolus cyanescens]|uniref:YEATS domain-containing protein n=1 Tax=Panaeolus cyanescens TaxID=181874 RepID=A0A409VAJ3_9AGAR|nr:hypothetical protein CVT24_010310 [Panaeolus cyanescens]